MTDENKPAKRMVKSTLNRKFGVSENVADKGFGRRPEREDRSFGEKRSFGDRKPFGEKRSFGDRKPFGEKRSFGDRKPFGEKRSFGDRKPFGEKRSFGDRKPFGEERSFGDRKPFGERRPFGDRKPFGEERSFGDRKPFGEERSFGDRKPFGERRPFGDRKPFGNDRPFGDRGRRPSSRPYEVWQDNQTEPQEPIYRQKPVSEEPVVFENDVELDVATIDAEPTTPPWFKKILALTTDKGREREGKFLAEGIHVIQELMNHHADLIESVYFVEDFKDENLINEIKAKEIRTHDLPADLMKKLSTTVTTQGILAICRIASTKPDYDKSRSVLTLVDAIQDPGNLGALFRTSLGFNSSGMILGKGTVSPFNSKVVRGSSGTFLRVPFEANVDLIEQINFLRQKGYTIVATDLHAKQTLSDIVPRKLKKIAFLVGNEGAGTKSYLIEIADESVRIPMNNNLESLNVAVAHGILSYEVAQLQKDM
jgi:tRNA G18 (ribose-2'-O)-methylase SpoU